MYGVGRMLEKYERYKKNLSENLKGKADLKELGVDGRIMLKRIFNKQNITMRARSIWLKTGSGAGCCKGGN
jgi:DNA-directed RNA polymerase subunit N (RpoN/RPB10)